MTCQDNDVGYFIAILNLYCADAFFRGVNESKKKLLAGKDGIRISVFILYWKILSLVLIK